jgi:hypothetical protein
MRGLHHLPYSHSVGWRTHTRPKRNLRNDVQSIAMCATLVARQQTGRTTTTGATTMNTTATTTTSKEQKLAATKVILQAVFAAQDVWEATGCAVPSPELAAYRTLCVAYSDAVDAWNKA